MKELELRTPLLRVRGARERRFFARK